MKKVVSKEFLKQLQALGRKIGVKILQRTVVKYVAPIVSIFVGAGWNYAATKPVASIAKRHLLARAAERKPPSDGSAAAAAT